jgi:hypothetical protein
VFFKTAREADRLIEGLQAQGVPYVFGVPGAKIVNYRRPRRLRHTIDIAAQLREDVLLRASVQIPQPFRRVLGPRSASTGRGLGPGRPPVPGW